MIEPSDVIDIGLWNRAQWSGVLFKGQQPGTLPVFVLVFRDLDAGEEILKGWRDALGDNDRNEVIRVSVIEGNIPGTPPGTASHIGPDQARAIESAKAKGEGPIIMCASRQHRMERAQDSPDLAAFKNRYALFVDMSSRLRSLTAGGPLLDRAHKITKAKIAFRQVSAIQGDQDLDRIVLMKPQSRRASDVN